jgi:predicted PurR-regulated permease PerM
MGSSPNPNFWQRLNNSSLLRFLLLFACGWAIVLVISYFYKVIAIFTAAAIIAALLNYPVQWLSRYIPRGVAIPVIFLATVTLLIVL